MNREESENMPDVEAMGGRVVVRTLNLGPISLTPDQAEALSLDLLRAAAEASQESNPDPKWG